MAMGSTKCPADLSGKPPPTGCVPRGESTRFSVRLAFVVLTLSSFTRNSKRVGMIKHRNRAQNMSPLIRRASAAAMPAQGSGSGDEPKP